MTTNPETIRRVALAKLAEMVAGKTVVCSDAQLESLIGHPVLDYVVSVPNPHQCGTLDRYVATVPPRFRAEAKRAFIPIEASTL